MLRITSSVKLCWILTLTKDWHCEHLLWCVGRCTPVMLTCSVLFYQASAASAAAAAAAVDDSDDPEIQFLKSLTPKQKKKLLKYVFVTLQQLLVQYFFRLNVQSFSRFHTYHIPSPHWYVTMILIYFECCLYRSTDFWLRNIMKDRICVLWLCCSYCTVITGNSWPQHMHALCGQFVIGHWSPVGFTYVFVWCWALCDSVVCGICY